MILYKHNIRYSAIIHHCTVDRTQNRTMRIVDGCENRLFQQSFE